MTRHDDRTRLRHMLDNAREAISLTVGRSRADLDTDRLFELGLVRLVEIIGEAASRLTEEYRQRPSPVPWPQVIAMRNRLVHGYDDIDLDVLWSTIQEDLPALIEQIESLLASSR